MDVFVKRPSQKHVIILTKQMLGLEVSFLETAARPKPYPETQTETDKTLEEDFQLNTLVKISDCDDNDAQSNISLTLNCVLSIFWTMNYTHNTQSVGRWRQSL